MTERHTKGGSPGGARSGIGPAAVPGHHTVSGDDRSDMTRAADAAGWKPYVRADDSEPPAVIAARERWRRREAELAAMAVAPVPESPRDPGAAEVAPDPEPPGRCETCWYLVTAIGHLTRCGGDDA